MNEAEPQKLTQTLDESASSNNSQLHSDTYNDESIDVKSHSSLVTGLRQKFQNIEKQFGEATSFAHTLGTYKRHKNDEFLEKILQKVDLEE